MFSVIFDMDGTLLDTQRICIPAWEYGGKMQGIENLGAVAHKIFGTNVAGSNAFLRENFPHLDIEKFRKDSRGYIEKNLKVEFKKGAKELLDYLKNRGIKIGLASGTSRPSVEHHLNEVGIFDYFDACVCGLEVENGKPAPDIFLLTAEKMGVNPKECFVFEDSKNGIIAGCKAGMKCIGVEDVVPFDNETQKLMFRQLEDLSQAIQIFNNLY